jgi:hypothetical protein
VTDDSHPWQDRIAKRLADIAALDQGWNDACPPIDPRAIEAARQFLGAVSVMTLAFPEIPQPGGIVPTGDGGVSVEWLPKGGAWASVEFTSDGHTEAISTSADDQQRALFGFRDDAQKGAA